jgi:hypothetical protein
MKAHIPYLAASGGFAIVFPLIAHFFSVRAVGT